MGNPGRFGVGSFAVRFLFAAAVVYATYNVEGLSYFHWVRDGFPSLTVAMGLAGVVLLIGWSILIRATVGSLGLPGVLLAAAFFGLLIWLLFDVLGIPADSVRIVGHVTGVLVACVLGIGVSWSHIRRRISGQVDTDELDREL